MPNPPMQPCNRCRAIVPTDKKSCPLYSKDTLGEAAPFVPLTKERRLFVIVGAIALIIALCTFLVKGALVSMKAYDMQAVPVEQAKQVHEGMTHREVIDLLGRDTAPIPVWSDFKFTSDQAILAVSENAKYNSGQGRAAACNPDRDDVCGAHYTLKDGSGLRLIYQRGVVVFARILYGNHPHFPKGAPN